MSVTKLRCHSYQTTAMAVTTETAEAVAAIPATVETTKQTNKTNKQKGGRGGGRRRATDCLDKQNNYRRH